jgi:hypothetical protein
MNKNTPSPLEIAKGRLRIPELWQLRDWPGKPGKSCKFPDGTDKNPSASVFQDGLLLKDYRSGNTYDAPGLLAEVEGMTPGAACRLFIQLSGVTPEIMHSAHFAPRQLNKPDTMEHRPKPKLPVLERGNEADLQALARLRSVSVEAVRMATARGFLWFANSIEGRAWILTDRERWNATARRLDGQTWQLLSSKPKARMLPKTWASWPIGLPEAADYPAIALVEGAPDLLAAFHFAVAQGTVDDIAPVCMASSGIYIPTECLSAFSGKRVRIFVHDDEAGRPAFENWTRQIEWAGGIVDGFDFSGLLCDDGAPVADLNDLSRIGAHSWEQWGYLVDSCMNFAPVPLQALPDPFHLQQEAEPHLDAEVLAAKLLTPRERDVVRLAGFENDPLILRAVELFDARIVTA